MVPVYASNVEKKITWRENAQHLISNIRKTIQDHVSSVSSLVISSISVQMKVKKFHSKTTLSQKQPQVEVGTQGVLLIQALEHGVVTELLEVLVHGMTSI